MKLNLNMSSNMKYYILNGILFTVMSTFYKTYAMKFLFRVGGSEYHISLFNALPGFVAVFATIPGIIWMNNAINKKRIMGIFFFASRLLVLSFALVPFFPEYFQPMIFVFLTGIQNFPETASATGLQSFSGDIFLPEERATAISLRNKFSTLAQLLAFFALGKFLSIPGESNSRIIAIYQILFVIAFFIGLWEIKTFFNLKETSCNTSRIKIDFKNSLQYIKQNKKFNSFMICSLLFHFGWQMGWPLFTIYQIKYLGADEGWLTILNITSSLVMFFSYNYWNNMIKRKGNPYVIAIATLGMAATPILYALSPNLYIMTITGLATGFFTAGTTTVILSSLLEVAPENERLFYVGIHATLTNITLAIAPMIGNEVLSRSSIYIALIVTAFFRLIGSIALFIRNKKVTRKISCINNQAQ